MNLISKWGFGIFISCLPMFPVPGFILCLIFAGLGDDVFGAYCGCLLFIALVSGLIHLFDNFLHNRPLFSIDYEDRLNKTGEYKK